MAYIQAWMIIIILQDMLLTGKSKNGKIILSDKMLKLATIESSW